MDNWIIITFIVIYALIIPWFVNWMILNRNNRVSFLESFHYLERKFNAKDRILTELVIFILVIAIMYEYSLLSMGQLYGIFYLSFGVIIIFSVEYILKAQFYKRNLNRF